MSDESKDSDELRELDMLLPFQATGRVMPSDVDRVDAYVRDHPDRLQIISEEKRRRCRRQ